MITKEEVKHLEENGHEEVARIITAYIENPQARMYVSITQFVNAVCDEIDLMTKNKQSILDAEDKKFERISTLIKNFSEFTDVFKFGNELMLGDTEGKDDEKGGADFFTKQAKKNGNNKQK